MRWMPILAALLLSFTLPIHAQNGLIPSQNQVQNERLEAQATEEPVTASLLVEQDSIQPGEPFWIAVRLKMEKGWDTYWMNPGDAGLPTVVDWRLPEGFTAGPLVWPYPERFDSDSMVGFGYTDSVLLFAKITPSKNISLGSSIKIGADVSWLACKESCVPGNASLSLDLPVKGGVPDINQHVTAQFMQARDRLPQPLIEEYGALSAMQTGEEIVLKFKAAPGQRSEVTEALFFPEQSPLIDHAAPQALKKGKEGFTLQLKKSADRDQSSTQVKGVLLISEKSSGKAPSGQEDMVKRAILVDTHLIETSATAAPATSTSAVWIAIGLAFVGGLILNVMPCVLPVVALKIFSFVKMANARRIEIFKHGAFFTGGVLLSFWALSGLLLILRSYGEGIGWGFQLQEPIFVVILASLLFLFGLSLFGLFEIGTSLISLGQKTTAQKTGLSASFWSGVLATAVATPCTGPLLGPALGLAMTLPVVSALAIFTSMALGMASPYLLCSAFPQLIRFLPKPGNWMIIFKQIMGFLMMGTVAWLVWVFSAQTDQMAMFVLLISLLILAVGGWVLGTWATPLRKKLTRMCAITLSSLIILGGGALAIFTASAHKESAGLLVENGQGGASKVADHPGWESFSPERLKELRASGVPVFVDFTAKWCLICQTNKVALLSQQSEQSFKEAGVVRMVADWTRRDNSITQELQKFGRTGVPLYVLYPGDLGKDPYILPQTLTSSIVTDYVLKMGAKRSTAHAE